MIGLLTLCGELLLLLYRRRRENPIDKLPGPKPWPLLGNVHQLDVDKIFLKLSDLAKMYGGIYRLNIYSRRVVVLNDYQYIHGALVQSREFAGRFNNNIIGSTDLFSISSADAGPEHSGRRRTMQTFAKKYKSGIQNIEDASQSVVDNLLQKFEAKSGNPMDVEEDVTHTAMDIMAILRTGKTGDHTDKELLEKTMALMNDILHPPRGILITFVRYLGNKNYKNFQEMIRIKEHLVHKWFEMKPEDGIINLLQSMSEEEQHSRHLQSMSVRGNLAYELLVAGTFTVANTIIGLMNVLCQHQDIQQKVRQEILVVIGPSRHPTLRDQEAMPYLRATFLEAGRYLTVTPMAIPHKTTKTSKLDPYTIPEGTEVWVNFWAMHHDEAFWDKPFHFRPERFLDADGQLVAGDHPNHRHAMPFGAGVRVCIGEAFAVSRMFLMMARILQNFLILPETTVEQQPSCDPRDMRIDVALLLPPPFKVRMIPIDNQDE